MSLSSQAHRTVAFFIALAVLLGGARAGASHAVVLLLFVGFVVVATVWVRGQYDVFVHDKPPWELWEKKKALTITLGVVGVIAVVLFPFLRLDGLGLAGLLLIYFAVGSAVAAWRRTSTNGALGYWLLGAGLGVVILGAALMGRVGSVGNVVVLIAVAAAVLGALPLAGAQLAEKWIAKLAALPPPGTDGPDTKFAVRCWWGFGGGGAFILAALVAGGLAGSWWVLVAIVALGLLIVALASSTQADIVVVLAGIALMGTTPLQASVPDALTTHTDDKNVLVALGDSYMSGEGASIFYDKTDDGGTNTCRRSPTAWAAIAGQQKPFDGLVFLACSGANTWNMRTDAKSVPTPTQQGNEPGTQLKQYADLKKDFAPALVVLSIGGNNAGFSTIGIMCVAPGNCNDKEELWTGGLAQVQTALEGTYDEVRATFKDTPVVVMAYPDPIDAANAKHCGQIALSDGEIDFITRFLHGLNSAVLAAATDHGFYYLSAMQSSLSSSHLQLCDPLNDGRPGLNFIGLRSVKGIAEQRFNPANWAHSSLHPNERGHAAMLRVFQNWLADQGGLKGLQAVAPDTTVRTPVVEPVAVPAGTQCAQLTTKDNECRTDGKKWAQQQVGLLLLTRGVIALAAVVAAWMAGVAFFAWRRRETGLTA
jgi:GDSL-like Lipase/Acylhydrolase family